MEQLLGTNRDLRKPGALAGTTRQLFSTALAASGASDDRQAHPTCAANSVHRPQAPSQGSCHPVVSWPGKENTPVEYLSQNGNAEVRAVWTPLSFLLT